MSLETLLDMKKTCFSKNLKILKLTSIFPCGLRQLWGTLLKGSGGLGELAKR